jgi:biotin carboxyl carrier protein
VVCTVDGERFEISVAADGSPAAAAAPAPAPAAGAQVAEHVLSPMPGDVVRLTCSDGDHVAVNQTVLILEALKLQMEVKTARAGRIRYLVRQGEAVRAKTPMAEIA